ncbi:MAG TPA: peptidase E [Gammaproteobacteria bacterium]|nr:peptidase E [Gammaproteobacteria bacterium]
MQQIIAIGGGGFGGSQKNLVMERYLIQQTQKASPKVCFLPQASAESSDYITHFYEAFCSLGALPSWISLFGRVENTWKEKLLQQDLIFVGGGNTRSMLALWREWGMDHILLEAYKQGIVLAGVSAGAICWFEQGMTDSVWPLGALTGLKMLSGSCCPHYDSEPERKPTYLSKVKSGEVMPGIALQDNTAAHFVNGKLKCIVASIADKKAFRVSDQGEASIALDCLV